MPRTCQWPTDPDDQPDWAAGARDVNTCGTRAPSFQAAPVDFDADDAPAPIDVCDVHKPAAEAATWKVRPYLTTRTRARLDAQGIVDRVLANVEVFDTPDPEQPDTADPQPHREIRQEIEVLRHIADRMAALPDDDARRRVATWVADRYGAPI